MVENLKVEVAAKGRPYNPNNDTMSEIDVEVPVYAIRGSYTRYQCDQSYTAASGTNAGKHCFVFEQPAASGVCFKTTFGDWKCGLADLTNRKQQANMPPPPKR